MGVQILKLSELDARDNLPAALTGGCETDRLGLFLAGLWGRLSSPSALAVPSTVLSAELFLVPTIYDSQFQSSHEKEQDL